MKPKLMNVVYTTATSLRGGGPAAEEDVADNLRYDCAFACDLVPGTIALPRVRTSHGDFGGRITGDRWRSFGVLIGTPARPPAEHRLEEHMSEWYTYRYPMRDDGSTNFQMPPERRTFTEFMAEMERRYK